MIRTFVFTIILILGWAPAASTRDAMPVSVVAIVRAPIAEEVNLTGTLNARRVSMLSGEVDGIVAKLHVDDGDRVTAGQAILELDSELAAIEKSRSAATVDEAAARLRESERRYTELTELAKQQHVPTSSVEAARAEIDVARAGLAQARAADRRAHALFDRHTVSAPFAGVIRRKLVEIGQWVESSSALVELVETSFLRLEAPVPQFYFSRVEKGTRAAIRFDALPDQVFETAITTTIPVSDTGARTFPVRIDIANEDGMLAPGMSARVVLQIQSHDDLTALIVPQDAVVQRPDGSTTVWAVVEDDGVTKALPRSITTGRIHRNNVEVLDGELSPGDRVVVRGNEILQPGQVVVVAEESAMDI